jgi:hypothetical protein
MAIKIGGTAFLKVDGNQYPLRGNFTVSPGAVERTMIAGQDYVHGFTEVPRVPFIEGDLSTLPSVLFDTLEQMVNVTVTAELLNGRTYVLKEAAYIRPADINTREGMARVRFEGTSMTEL